MTWEIFMITLLSIAVILLARYCNGLAKEMAKRDKCLYDILDEMAKYVGFLMEDVG